MSKKMGIVFFLNSTSGIMVISKNNPTNPGMNWILCEPMELQNSASIHLVRIKITQAEPHDGDFQSCFSTHVLVPTDNASSFVCRKILQLQRWLSEKGYGAVEEVAPNLLLKFTGEVVTDGVRKVPQTLQNYTGIFEDRPAMLNSCKLRHKLVQKNQLKSCQQKN